MVVPRDPGTHALLEDSCYVLLISVSTPSPYPATPAGRQAQVVCSVTAAELGFTESKLAPCPTPRLGNCVKRNHATSPLSGLPLCCPGGGQEKPPTHTLEGGQPAWDPAVSPRAATSTSGLHPLQSPPTSLQAESPRPLQQREEWVEWKQEPDSESNDISLTSTGPAKRQLLGDICSQK